MNKKFRIVGDFSKKIKIQKTKKDIANLSRLKPTAITVVMFTYNHESFVDKAIESVLEQRISQQFHLVIYDDFSTDKTREILIDYARKYPAIITLINSRENLFKSGFPMMPRIIEAIKSEYIAICEGDDYWISHEKLQIQLDFMQKQSWCSVSHHAVEIESDTSISIETKMRVINWFNQEKNKTLRNTAESLIEGNYIATCSSMYRRKMLNSKKLKKLKNITVVDLALIALACENGDIGFIDQKLSTYRLHSTNYWATMDPKNQKIEIKKVDKLLSKLLKKEVRQTFIKRYQVSLEEFN